MPVYRVDRPNMKPRIVDAPNPAAARQHVAQSEISVSKITATDAFKLAQDPDTRLEVAGEEAQIREIPQEPRQTGAVGGAQQPQIDEPGTAGAD